MLADERAGTCREWNEIACWRCMLEMQKEDSNDCKSQKDKRDPRDCISKQFIQDPLLQRHKL